MHLAKLLLKNCFISIKLNRYSSRLLTTKTTESDNNRYENRFFNEKKISIARPELTLEERRKTVESKIEYLKETGEFLPIELTNEQWEIILKEKSETRILKMLKYFSRKYYYKLKKNEEKKVNVKQHSPIDPNKFEVTNYPGYRSIFGHIAKIDNYYNMRLLTSIRLNDPQIVFDFRYETIEDKYEMLSSLTNQLIHAYCVNRKSIEPFQIAYCNLNENGAFSNLLDKRMPFRSTLVNYTNKSYLDLYDSDKLVYLSPDAKRDMTEYDPNKTYIIGVLGDKTSCKLPHTHMQAKRDNIKCERLPIERYAKIIKGQKELCLDHVVQILLALKHGKPWKEAFKFLPTRKINY